MHRKVIRTVPLGDRWDDEVGIAKKAIRVVTTRSGPADDSGERRITIIEANGREIVVRPKRSES